MPLLFSRLRQLAAVLVLALTCSATAHAQQTAAPNGQEVVTVGVTISPPFVVSDGDGFDGMAIDLWHEVALRLGLRSEFVAYPNFRDLVDAASDGRVDVAVTNLTINKARAAKVDFTQPWLDAGLRILVEEDRGASFSDIISGLADLGYLRAYLWLGIVILGATALLTVFDRRFDATFPRDWLSGVAESFYQVMSVATSGRSSRKQMFGAWGRFVSAIWLVCGVAVLAYVTSSVTSVMTAFAITNQINSIADLPGKRIGVLDGSTSDDYATGAGFSTTGFESINAAVTALEDNRIDAIIGDAPVLEYLALTQSGTGLDVVGPIFSPEKYGFAASIGSELRRDITLTLLELKESGTLEDIRVRYFGVND